MYFSLAIAWAVFFLWFHRRESSEKGLPAWGPRAGVWALLLTAAFIYFVYLALSYRGFEHAFPIDDSYITLTAARNVALHNQLAVNPEYPLAGVTSPLHATLTGLLGKLIGVEHAVRVIGLIAFLFVAYGAYVWTQQLGGSRAAALGISFALILAGPLAFGALNGMETTPFAALILWAFVFYEKSEKRPKLVYAMGALAGLAILTRPEGWFLTAALFAAKLIRHRRAPRALLQIVVAGALAGLIAAPYLIANHHLLGAFFPPTVSAKRQFFYEWCEPLPLKTVVVALSTVFLFGTIDPLAAAAWLLFCDRTWWKRLYPPLFLAIFYGSYVVNFPGALTHYWGRYQHPLTPVVFVGMGLGAARLHRALRSWRRVVGAAFGVAATAFFAVAGAFSGNVQDAAYRHALGTANGFLNGVCNWVRSQTAPGDTVATLDIGAMYYFGERKVLDLVGLADPEVAATYGRNQYDDCGPGARYDDLYELVKRRKPKILYLAPINDRRYLHLLENDGGRHLREKFVLTLTANIGLARNVTVTDYHFYLCDWEHDRRGALLAQAPGEPR